MDGVNWIIEYRNAINDGRIIVGKYIRLLYEYLVAGLDAEWFFYDAEKATKAVEWIETHCFHTEGPLAPGPIKLELWQRAMLSAMFGIVDADGCRQFKEVLLVVARKNGKSKLASCVADYMWRECGGYGTRVYCIAPKLDQADIIYNDIWQMVTLDPEYQEQIRQYVQENGLEAQVRYVGELCPGEELNQYYNAASLTVFPSKLESFGLVIIESMSAGTPVLLANKPLFALEQDCTVYSSEEEFVNCVDELLRTVSRAEMGRAEVCSAYSWDKVAADHLDIWNK